MSLREAQDQIVQAKRHIEAAEIALALERKKELLKEVKAPPAYSPRVGDVIEADYLFLQDGTKQLILVTKVRHQAGFSPGVDGQILNQKTKTWGSFVMNSDIGRTVLYVRRATREEMIQAGIDECLVDPYTPKVGDVITLKYNGDWAAVVKNTTSDGWVQVLLDLNVNRPITFHFTYSEVGESVAFIRRATPDEMARCGIVEGDVKPAYAPEVGHFVQYSEMPGLVRQGAVIAVDGEATTIRLGVEGGLVISDRVPRSMDHIFCFMGYATGDEMGIKVGEPAKVSDEDYPGPIVAEVPAWNECPQVRIMSVSERHGVKTQDISVGSDDGFRWVATVENRRVAIEFANHMYGVFGIPLSWTRPF